jgi:putative ABC transport system permease protein
MPAISNLNIERGRSFTESRTSIARVAHCRLDIVDNMLGGGDPLGKEIRVDGTPYTVIGVGERQGKIMGKAWTTGSPFL